MVPTTPEVKNARIRLDGVLQGLVERRHDGSPGSEDEGDEETLHSNESESQKAKKPPRKRRKKDDFDDGGSYHHTYVMKLFDRSVDLAQFSEETPLYPIARAWMQNQPHNRHMLTAATLDVDVERSREHNDALDDVTMEVNHGHASNIPDCYHLPLPARLDDRTLEQMRLCGKTSLRVPDVVNWTKEPFFVYSGPEESVNGFLGEARCSNPSSQENLLQNHLRRWKVVREQWREQSAVNEARFSDSMDLLKRMFEESQSSLN